MFDKKLASGEHGGIAAVCGKAKLAAKLASHSVRDSHTLTTTFVKCSNRCSFIARPHLASFRYFLHSEPYQLVFSVKSR
jgi:hypothetical protein